MFLISTSWFLLIITANARQSQRLYSSMSTQTSTIFSGGIRSDILLADPHLRGKSSQSGWSTGLRPQSQSAVVTYKLAPSLDTSIQCSWAQRFPGVSYNGRIIDAYSNVRSEEHCAQLCGRSSVELCLSVNWNREDGTCELNGEAMTTQNYWYKFRFVLQNRYIDTITCTSRYSPTAPPGSGLDGTQQCGIPEQQNVFTGGQYRIVGGRPTSDSNWPWQAVIVRGTQLFCGGALVRADRPDVIVTAAHCLENGIQDVRVLLGTHAQGRVYEAEESLKIVSFAVHENYNRVTTENDISLVKLERPASLSSSKRAICLPTPDMAPAVGTECVVTGWGILSYSGSPTTLPSRLQEATVPIYDSNICNDANHYNGLIKENMMCAAPTGGGIDACQGDSGGPLVCKAATGAWFLQGIISWGNGCGNPKFPGVYTKVANYYTWLQEKMTLL